MCTINFTLLACKLALTKASIDEEHHHFEFKRNQYHANLCGDMSSRSALLELNWSPVFRIFRQSKNRDLCKRRWKSDGRPTSSVEERDSAYE